MVAFGELINPKYIKLPGSNCGSNSKRRFWIQPIVTSLSLSLSLSLHELPSRAWIKMGITGNEFFPNVTQPILVLRFLLTAD